MIIKFLKIACIGLCFFSCKKDDETNLSSEKAITQFTINGEAAVIDESAKTIALTLPSDTDVTSLAPTIVISQKASVTPASGTSHNFSNPVTYTVTAEDATTVDYTVTITVTPPMLSSEKTVTQFTINGEVAVIDESAKTIALTLPSDTDVTSLAPTIVISQKASVTPASGTSRNFSNPVTYTVTAEDTTTVDYTVTITVTSSMLSSEKVITQFTINGQVAVIDESAKTIALTLPSDTDVTSLDPTIVISQEASVTPASGTSRNFSNPVTYTVTAEDATTVDYTVTITVTSSMLSSEKAITQFTINGQVAVIDESAKTIALTLPSDTDVTSLAPTIVISQEASVTPASGTSHNFSNPVTYTVTAEDATTVGYTVTVTVTPPMLSSEKAITQFTINGEVAVIDESAKTIALTLPSDTDVTSLAPTIVISQEASVTPASGASRNFSNPVTYTVTAEDATTVGYTVTVTVTPPILSSEKAITQFTINGQVAVIDESAKTIALTLPSGTDVTSLAPTIVISQEASVTPASGASRNFSNPVTYTVTAEDATTVGYTVTVTVTPPILSSEKAITQFTINGQVAVIDESAKTIALTLPSDTDVTSLAPTIVISQEASVTPASRTPHNFSNPVTYTVTAEDATTVGYTVTVTLITRTSACINDVANIYTFNYGGKNYEVVRENKNWVAAAACAVERGGYLAEINDAAEQNAVFLEIQNNSSITVNNTIAPDGGNGAYIWIGGNDIAREGNWVWDGNNGGTNTQFWMGMGVLAVGGTPGTPVDGLYSNWSAPEPDDFHNQDALGLSLNGWPLGSAGQWNDIGQDNSLYFLIEYN